MEDDKSSNTSVEKEEEKEAEEVLKKKISDHPLYGLLVETHSECLKVGSIDDMDQTQEVNMKLPNRKPRPLDFLCQSELDYFMKAYCCALGKLREALEQPQRETIAFINGMQSQLRELTSSETAAAAPGHHAPSTSFSLDQSPSNDVV